MTHRRISLRALGIAGIAPAALMVAAFSPTSLSAADPVVEAQIATPAPVATRWSVDAARDLLAAIDAADREGLTPADYAPDGLRQAIAHGRGAALDAAADASGMKLARDYLLGHVQDRSNQDWHIERSAYEAQALNDGLARAAATGDVRRYLTSLLPDNKQYRDLRTALARSEDATETALIRANMERWRWMPRMMGDEYLYVNVPTYQLKVMRGGTEQASYDVVVGAPKTPTPALAVAAERVVVNPWWTLPPSVLSEGKRYSSARGYVYTRAASGKMMVRQKPGPNNALGRVKIDMPNPHAIYLHDTPAKAAFARTDRALSHGCIRVKGIEQLATELEGDGRVDEALAGRDTQTVGLTKQVPVYIVYMTAQVRDGAVQSLRDIYGRDAALMSALDRGATTRLAAAGGRQVAAR